MWVNLSRPRRVRPSRPAENVHLQDTSHASQLKKTGVSETPTPVVGSYNRATTAAGYGGVHRLQRSRQNGLPPTPAPISGHCMVLVHSAPALSPSMQVFTHGAWATRAGRLARPPSKATRHDLPSSAENTAFLYPRMPIIHDSPRGGAGAMPVPNAPSVFLTPSPSPAYLHRPHLSRQDPLPTVGGVIVQPVPQQPPGQCP